METTVDTGIDGVVRFAAAPHTDERGFFCRTLDAEVLRGAGIAPGAFVQDSVSRSHRGVVRGLHTRLGAGEAKVVRCSWGRVFDVVVDLRPWSPTFLAWRSFELDGDAPASLYIPAGCAHGFQALSEVADVCYRIDRPHDPAEDAVVAYDDPGLGICWPEPVTAVSARDRSAPSLARYLEATAAGEGR